MNFHQRLLQYIENTQMWLDLDDTMKANVEKIITWSRSLGKDAAEYVTRILQRFFVVMSEDKPGDTKWATRANKYVKKSDKYPQGYGDYSEERIVRDFFFFAKPDNQFKQVYARYIGIAATNQVIARALEEIRYIGADGLDREPDKIYDDLNAVGDKISKLEKLPQGKLFVQTNNPPGKWAIMDTYSCPEEGDIMKHPLEASTEVITYDGTFTIKQLAGKGPIKLLTTRANGMGTWAEGTFKSFGEQKLRKITLTRSGKELVFHATPEHRWFARRRQKTVIEEFTTDALTPGCIIPRIFAKNVFYEKGEKNAQLSPVGVMHGITFGDGCCARLKKEEPKRSASTILYGKKDVELLKWFPAASETKTVTRSTGGIMIKALPRFFKKLPDLNECTSYLLGWLAGYFAADGSVKTNGVSVFASAKLENLKFVEILCQRFGIRNSGISGQLRWGFGKQRMLYTLTLEVGALPGQFYLLSSHRSRVKKPGRTINWTVKSVEETDRVEEVFCAVVPETHCFVIKGNTLSSNCGNQGGRAGDLMLSFRTPSSVVKGFYEPHLTFIYNPKTKALGEMKAKANTKCPTEYHMAVLDLLKSGKVKKLIGAGFRPEVNFTLNDLSDANFTDLYSSQPELCQAQLTANDNYQKLDKHHKELLDELEKVPKEKKKPQPGTEQVPPPPQGNQPAPPEDEGDEGEVEEGLTFTTAMARLFHRPA